MKNIENWHEEKFVQLMQLFQFLSMKAKEYFSDCCCCFFRKEEEYKTNLKEADDAQQAATVKRKVRSNYFLTCYSLLFRN